MGCSGSKAASPGGSSAQSGIARRNTSAEFDLASSGGYAQSRLSVAMPSTSAAASTLATRDLDHGGVGGGSRRSMSAAAAASSSAAAAGDDGGGGGGSDDAAAGAAGADGATGNPVSLRVYSTARASVLLASSTVSTVEGGIVVETETRLPAGSGAAAVAAAAAAAGAAGAVEGGSDVAAAGQEQRQSSSSSSNALRQWAARRRSEDEVSASAKSTTAAATAAAAASAAGGQRLYGALEKLSPAHSRWQPRLFTEAADLVTGARCLFYYKRAAQAKAASKAAHRASVFSDGVVMSSLLEKRASSALSRQRWQARHFRMSGHYLKYYAGADDADHTLKGHVDLEGLLQLRVQGTVLSLRLAGSRELTLRAADAALAGRWEAQLARFIMSADEQKRGARTGSSGSSSGSFSGGGDGGGGGGGAASADVLSGAPEEVGWRAVGRIPFTDFKVAKAHFSRKTGESDPRRFSLVVATDDGYSEREFVLRAKNAAEAEHWRERLAEHVAAKNNNARGGSGSGAGAAQLATAAREADSV